MGNYNVGTGVDDHSQLGVLKQWNYAPRTEIFPDKCGKLYGSMGEFHPTYASPNKPLAVFTPDMCRTLEIDFKEEVDVHGVKGFKYVGGERLVDNGTRYPENSCFCAGECMPSGVLNISNCRFGTPVFMSYPHFLHADPYYVSHVDGMKPSPDKHELFVVIEPVRIFGKYQSKFWQIFIRVFFFNFRQLDFPLNYELVYK